MLLNHRNGVSLADKFVTINIHPEKKNVKCVSFQILFSLLGFVKYISVFRCVIWNRHGNDQISEIKYMVVAVFGQERLGSHRI